MRPTSRLFLLVALAAVLAATLAVGSAHADTALTVDSGWQVFGFVGSSPPPQQPFTFTNTSPVALQVTDILCPGDVYTVYDNGSLIGTTTQPGLSTCDYAASTADPDTAFADPVYSGGWATVGPGSHSITIVPSSPYPSGGGYIRIIAMSQIRGQAAGGGARHVMVKKFH